MLFDGCNTYVYGGPRSGAFRSGGRCPDLAWELSQPPERSRSGVPTSQLSTGEDCTVAGRLVAEGLENRDKARAPAAAKRWTTFYASDFEGDAATEIWGDVGRHILSGLRVYTRNGVTVRSRDTPYRLRTTYARTPSQENKKEKETKEKVTAYDYARTPRQENIHQISLGGRALV